MIKPSGIVTLLTDFGLTDPFVGIMHGVLLKRHADFKIVDLTHGIEPQNIHQAAFWIAASYRDFPEGTVHVVVVDPGVGSDRRAIIAELDGHYFVAPDNGVLDLVVREAEQVEIRALRTWPLNLERVSKTFHGRDIFAPAAAEIGSGRLWMSELGQVIEDYDRLDVSDPVREGDSIRGQIFTLDHFGNVFSNIPHELYRDLNEPEIHVGALVLPLKETYAEVPSGTALALTNSFDRLEIAVRDGHAQSQLQLDIGQAIEIKGKQASNK